MHESVEPVAASVDAAPEAPASDAVPMDVVDWQPLPAPAGTLMMISGLLTGLLAGFGLVFLAWRAFEAIVALAWWQQVVAVLLVWALVGLLGLLLGYRRWRASFWKLDDTGLYLKRGRAFRKEILVPRSRVQHLDIERGPIERHFGLATLVIHTAGTRQHAIRQPGLADADAVALRDALVPASAGHDDVL
jgi:membrane protein YdbS with pleckstrin-like domain